MERKPYLNALLYYSQEFGCKDPSSNSSKSVR